MFWNAGAVGFHMAKLKKKTALHKNDRAWWDFAQKCKCSWIFRKKTSFWESASYHHEMFGVTNFGLVLCICIVVAMIFIKEYIGKLVQDSFFYEFLEIFSMTILSMLTRICLVFFSCLIIQNLVIKNSRTCVWAY